MHDGKSTISARPPPQHPLLHLVRLLGPSFAVGEGGGGGGSSTSTSNPPAQNEVFNPYKRSSDVASNREEGGGTKSFDGRSKSTKKGHKGAKKKWNAFAEINKLPQLTRDFGTDKCDDIEEPGEDIEEPRVYDGMDGNCKSYRTR